MNLEYKLDSLKQSFKIYIFNYLYQNTPRFHQKYHNFCSEDDRKTFLGELSL